MANRILTPAQDGTPVQICFRDLTDFGPAAANDLRVGSPTLVNLDLTGVASAAARQSAKFDFGALRAPRYVPRGALELAATPTAGLTIDLYLAPSGPATAGTANAGGASGADAAYTGYSSNLEASIKQLQFIGAFVVTAQATATIQIAEGQPFEPYERYGSLIVINRSGAAFHSDAVEIHIVFDPVFDEVQ